MSPVYRFILLAAAVFLFSVNAYGAGLAEPREKARAFERGDYYFHNNEFKNSIDEFTKAINIDPQWAEAYLRRGNARIWGIDADLKLGQEDINKAAELDPKYADYALAFRFYINRNFLHAIEVFTRVIQSEINLMDAYSDRGNSYTHLGEFEIAIADHSEAIRLSPNFAGNYSNRAYVYNEMGQYELAISDCDRAIELYPEYYWVFGERGHANYLLGNYHESAIDYTNGINMQSDNENIAFRWYLRRGNSNMMRGEYDEALKDVDYVLRLDPRNDDALYLRDLIHSRLRAGGPGNDTASQAFERGVNYFYNNEFRNAIEQFSEAIEISPEWAEAYLRRGSARVWGLDFDLMLGQEDFDRAAQLNPIYNDYARAVRAYIGKNYLIAIELFNRVIMNGINLMDAYSDRANSYSSLGDFDNAIADHSAAIRLSPGFAGNYSNRAFVYNQTEKYDLAISDCDMAILLYPAYFWVFFDRGYANYQLGNYLDSANDFTNGINMQSGNDNIALTWYLHRGNSYLKNGDYDKAMADADYVLNLDPRNGSALHLKSLIESQREQ